MSDLTQMGLGIVPASVTWQYLWDNQSTTLMPMTIPDSAAWRVLLDKNQVKLNRESRA